MPHRRAIAPGRLVLVLVVTGFALMVVIVLLLWVQRQQTEVALAQQRSRLGGVRLAIENYVKANGILPNVGSSKSVGVSWRVRLLPYIDSKEEAFFFSVYDRSNEWDSEANAQLHSRPAPRMFRVDGDEFANTTDIVILDSNLIDEAVAAGCAMLPVAESETKLWIVAIPDLSLHWLNPDDRTNAAELLRK